MGVTEKDVALLLALRERGVSFERTLTIGRQGLRPHAAGLLAAAQEAGVSLSPVDAERIAGGERHAEPLLRHLGARECHSIDASGYEGATYVHDMNTPLPAELEQHYSLVYDGGSLEHIFNVAQTLKNYMSAVEVGGHLLVATTCNNYVGHGFYQFSPEFMYRALSPENGFRTRVVLVRDSHRFARWRVVCDPAEVGRRVKMTGPWPTTLWALARRTSDATPFASWPQQSDYVMRWGGNPRRAARKRPLRRLPGRLQRIATLVELVTGTTTAPEDFEPVELQALKLRE